MKNIFLMLIITLIIFSCAKPNKTFQPEPSQVQIDKFYQTRGYARDFTIDDNHLFVAVDQNGFSIFDMNTDTLIVNYSQYLNYPRLINVAHTSSETLLFVYDIYGSPASINCFNIADISNPQYLPPIITDTGGIEDLDILSSTENDTIQLRFTKNDASSHKLKISNALHINFTWQFTPLIDADQLFDYDVHNFDKFDENHYYIANEQKGIAYINTTDPNNPVIDKYIDTPGSAYDVKRVDNYLYVADRHEGFEVYELQGDNWKMIYHYDTSGLAKQLAIYQGYAALASGGGGIYIFDISNPQTTKLLTNIDDSEIGYSYKVKFFNGILYAATRNGVYKFKIEN